MSSSSAITTQPSRTSLQYPLAAHYSNEFYTPMQRWVIGRKIDVINRDEHNAFLQEGYWKAVKEDITSKSGGTRYNYVTYEHNIPCPQACCRISTFVSCFVITSLCLNCFRMNGCAKNLCEEEDCTKSYCDDPCQGKQVMRKFVLNEEASKSAYVEDFATSPFQPFHKASMMSYYLANSRKFDRWGGHTFICFQTRATLASCILFLPYGKVEDIQTLVYVGPDGADLKPKELWDAATAHCENYKSPAQAQQRYRKTDFVVRLPDNPPLEEPNLLPLPPGYTRPVTVQHTHTHRHNVYHHYY